MEILVRRAHPFSSKLDPPLYRNTGVERAGWRGRKSCPTIAPGLSPAGSTRLARCLRIGPIRRTGWAPLREESQLAAQELVLVKHRTFAKHVVDGPPQLVRQQTLGLAWPVLAL